MIRIFRDHVAPPDFAKNTDMADDLVYKTCLNFLSHFCLKKSLSYKRSFTVAMYIFSTKYILWVFPWNHVDFDGEMSKNACLNTFL